MAERASAGFVVIWEFAVPAANSLAFEQAYGPRGAWVTLFRRDDAYLETTLLRQKSGSADAAELLYVTVDWWRSEARYEAFRKAHAEAYAAIDAECEGLTLHEQRLGAFRPAR